jgi:uncharacterized protein with LGFP repeats
MAKIVVTQNLKIRFMFIEGTSSLELPNNIDNSVSKQPFSQGKNCTVNLASRAHNITGQSYSLGIRRQYLGSLRHKIKIKSRDPLPNGEGIGKKAAFTIGVVKR